MFKNIFLEINFNHWGSFLYPIVQLLVVFQKNVIFPWSSIEIDPGDKRILNQAGFSSDISKPTSLLWIGIPEREREKMSAQRRRLAVYGIWSHRFSWMKAQKSFSNNKKNVCGAHTRRQSAEECSTVFELIDALISWPFIHPLSLRKPLAIRLPPFFDPPPVPTRWNIFSPLEVEEWRRDISGNSSSTRSPFNPRFRRTSLVSQREFVFRSSKLVGSFSFFTSDFLASFQTILWALVIARTSRIHRSSNRRKNRRPRSTRSLESDI